MDQREGERRRSNVEVLKHYKWAVPIMAGAVMGLVGGLGFQYAWPNDRLNRLEAQQARQDTAFTRFSGIVSMQLAAMMKLKCLEADTGQEQRLLQVANIPCYDLLGNRTNNPPVR